MIFKAVDYYNVDVLVQKAKLVQVGDNKVGMLDWCSGSADSSR